MKAPAFQWYPKQWLGDNKVQGMDWDAQAMHFHLINLAWQEEPPGTIPADEPLIRRWLRLPSDHPDSEKVWRRVRPQIFGAWVRSADGTRWVQKGLVEAAERQERYRRRYDDAKHHSKSDENDVKNIGDYKEDEDVNELEVAFELKAPTSEELVYCEYPRKVGKRAALSAICKALERLRKGENGSPLTSKDDAAVFLLQRVKMFAKSPKGQNGDYTPHPATWFNQSRYLDDESVWYGGNDNGRKPGYTERAEEKQRAGLESLARAASSAFGWDDGRGADSLQGQPADGSGAKALSGGLDGNGAGLRNSEVHQSSPVSLPEGELLPKTSGHRKVD